MKIINNNKQAINILILIITRMIIKTIKNNYTLINKISIEFSFIMIYDILTNYNFKL